MRITGTRNPDYSTGLRCWVESVSGKTQEGISGLRSISSSSIIIVLGKKGFWEFWETHNLTLTVANDEQASLNNLKKFFFLKG